MLTRTGDYAQSTRTSQLLLDAQTRSRATQIQISSGKVAQQFSGIAADARRLVSAKDALSASSSTTTRWSGSVSR